MTSIRHEPQRAPRPTEILDPSGRSTHLKLVEEPPLLRGEPGTFSLRFVSLCLLAPYGVGAWYFYRELSQGIDDPLVAIGLAIFILAGPGLLTILHLLNRHFRSRGPFFILDTAQGELSLPRVEVVLPRSQVVHFVLLQGPVKIEQESVLSHELSVLRRSPENAFEYLPVAIDDPKRYIARAGKRLAEFFEVPLHELRAR
ncbi:MAG: hypothetical protein DWQ35_18950 [Planctomycetota bacterium]|nr:MAG: hypothetical protein DWQ35_18950 [Planctomycetota bacterium]REK31211.1 MAG: hypothetical protein DWQ42_00810 [Planctomycetota bacterium]REK43549.1 MAG: hypothetical protein DWQ46_10695 [Planctomycetota bacterium]